MSKSTRVLLISNIKLPVSASFEEAFSVAKKRLGTIGIKTADASLSVYKKSVDARNKSDIKFVYTVAASGEFGALGRKALEQGITELSDASEPEIVYGSEPLDAPPLIVGSGPCGLFAALLLAENGYKPYYLYRQKNILEDLENTGFCKDGTEGIYNICMMEEISTVISAGVGAVTKLVKNDRIERIFNVKDVREYINRAEEMRKRKDYIYEFYKNQEV